MRAAMDPAKVTHYRGCTIEQVDDGYYVHHESESEDFGHRLTLERAQRLVDEHIANGVLPHPPLTVSQGFYDKLTRTRPMPLSANIRRAAQ